jgi:hypothetical protein
MNNPAGIAFDGLHTEFGVISASVARIDSRSLRVRMEGIAKAPMGIQLASPLSIPIRQAKLDGKMIEVKKGNCIEIPTIPASVDLEY